jgi:hypothetical protein
MKVSCSARKYESNLGRNIGVCQQGEKLKIKRGSKIHAIQSDGCKDRARASGGNIRRRSARRLGWDAREPSRVLRGRALRSSRPLRANASSGARVAARPCGRPRISEADPARRRGLIGRSDYSRAAADPADSNQCGIAGRFDGKRGRRCCGKRALDPLKPKDRRPQSGGKQNFARLTPRRLLAAANSPPRERRRAAPPAGSPGLRARSPTCAPASRRSSGAGR